MTFPEEQKTFTQGKTFFFNKRGENVLKRWAFEDDLRCTILVITGYRYLSSPENRIELLNLIFKNNVVQ